MQRVFLNNNKQTTLYDSIIFWREIRAITKKNALITAFCTRVMFTNAQRAVIANNAIQQVN